MSDLHPMTCHARLAAVLPLCFVLTPAAATQDTEHAAQAAEQAGRLGEALDLYQVALRSLPDPPPAEADLRLRERIVRLTQKMQTPPRVSEEAERFAVRCIVAFKDATSEEGVGAAAAECRKAVRAAPWYGPATFNLALVEQRLGRYGEALANLKLFLLTGPEIAQADRARAKVYELEYREEETAAAVASYVAGGKRPREPEAAVKLYSQACDRGIAKGCWDLAAAYKNGWGVAEDPARGLGLYGRACGLGLPAACGSLGRKLLSGEGVVQDRARGIALLEQTCAVSDPRDHIDAAQQCWYLGLVYRHGLDGIGRDDGKAYGFFARACELGDPESCRAVKKLRKPR